MRNGPSGLDGFMEHGADRLQSLLDERLVLPPDRTEALVYALREVAGSIQKVYWALLPRTIDDPEITAETLRDLIWDIREEFRHIDYHIHDGLLP